MIVPSWFRLALYVAAAMLPIWADYFAKSADYSLRGLIMPALAAAYQAVLVVLARTRAKDAAVDQPPTQ